MKLSPWVFALIISCSLSYGQFGKDFEDMSQTEKMLMYNSHIKSPAVGVLFEFLLPTLGHAYAGNWKRGLAFKGAQIGTWIIIDLLGPSEIGRYTGDEGEYAIGISVLIQIWELIDIGMETKRYNHNLYREIFGKEPPSFSLNLQPTYQGANLTLAYKFD